MPHAAVRLFDLDLARRLLALGPPALALWLDEHLDGLKERTRRGVAAWLEAMHRELPAELCEALPPLEAFVAHWDDLVVELASAPDDQAAAAASAAIAEKAAFGEARLPLDACGGLRAVFGGAPAGAVSSLQLFPGEAQERYVLLLPEHVDRMVAALRGRCCEDSPMSDAEVAALSALAERCRVEPGLRVAYLREL